MSNEWKRRPGTIHLGTVPAGTVVTPELIDHLMSTQPRQPFDIEGTVERIHPRTNNSIIANHGSWIECFAEGSGEERD